MKPYKVNMWVYADDDAEAQALEDALSQFVVEKYNQHIYPRAKTIQALLKRFGDSALVNNYLRQ